MEKATTDRICVQVFAKISASISHEIKNTLSIINENAGLLDDFAHMAEEGVGVAVERVHAVTKTIAKQVDRSNIIMKNLNRFAHSADNYVAHGNLEETLALVVALTDRQAAMKNITTTLHCPPDIAFSTYLITFESLVYLTVLALFQASTEGSTLAIEVEDETPKITICFTVQSGAAHPFANYPDDDQKALAEQIAASCRIEENQLFLSFPCAVS
ncbi:HAMP domain-containing histidine kinase [Desulfopila sp. IMCC35006]|uniref:HAMP domain-containing histidine kinase n=1 Tax=Desulfopila sp. IMCC35006 TaxID=2569542 RepID=UPI0010ACDD9C|nr:HAMP domain-containing histidine kinase [Desulfopila sp. IMCC35006]TKB27519.1 HAMP domain-containing histidine kinase [Desulfopila sp. IMCC35006]